MLEIIKEYIVFLKQNKKLWLLPIFLILCLFGVLIIVSKGSTFAPFIYTLF